MKIFIYLFVYLVSMASVLAQSIGFETTIRDDFFTSSSTILPLDNGETIIVGDKYESGGWGSNTLRLDRLDASGNLLWTKTYPDHVFFHHVESVIIGTDNFIYLNLWNGGCDYIISTVMMKLDNDGNIEWFQQDKNFVIYNNMKANTEGGFWAMSGKELIEYDGNLDTIQIISLSASIRSFDHDTSTGDFVVVTENDMKKLIYYTANGDTQEIYISQTPQVHFWGDYILARYSDKIEHYDKQLNLIDSVALPKQYQVWDFDNEWIYLVDKAYDNSPDKILKLNQNLEITDSIEWQYGKINAVEVVDDHLYVLGGEYTHTFLKTINNDFSYTNTNTDIGIVNVLVATADSTCYQPYYCDGVCEYDATGIKAVVKNFGTETVDYLELNALYESGCGSICYDAQAYMVIHDNVYIPPGEVDTLDFLDMELWQQARGTRLCLYTTRPNELLDKDHTNDQICRNFFYNDITSVDPAEGDFKFSIFPNPARDIINLQNTVIDWQKVNIKIITVEGKQIEVETPQVDISTFPAGVYLVHCEYEGLTRTERFVKY